MVTLDSFRRGADHTEKTNHVIRRSDNITPNSWEERGAGLASNMRPMIQLIMPR